MKWFIGISLPVLIFLNIYDFYSTATLLGQGVEEANPYMKWMIECLGVVNAMLLTKGVFLILLCWVSYLVCTRPVTNREIMFVVGGLLILNTYYLYFMYTRNFQYMLLMN